MLFALVLALPLPLQGEAPAPLGVGRDGFPVFVWRERHRAEPLPEALLRPFGGTNLFRHEEAPWVFERGVDAYVTNAAGRDDLHPDLDDAWLARIERWIETRDEALLMREPCLSDPATLARLEATLARTLAARGGRHGLGLSLGDEVSLTPNGNPLDLCRSPTCLTLWREHARERGLPADPPTTDDVRLALGEDDGALVGPWLAFRRFQHARLVSVLDGLIARVRRAAPGTPVGLLGLSGITPFGGVPTRAVRERFDFLEVYPVGAARLFALDGDGPRAFATVFLQDESPPGAAWVVWEHALRGGDGLVLWNDRWLAERPRHTRAVAVAVVGVRYERERLPALGRPLAADVGLLEDDDSAMIAWLQDAQLDGPTWPRRFTTFHRANGTRERKFVAWEHLLTDAGASPRVVDAATPDWPTVLVLVDQHVVDEPLRRRLAEHLTSGGTLVVDGPFARVDRTGRPWPRELLTELRERDPGSVLAPPAGLERYVAHRLDPERSARLRAAARALIDRGETPWPALTPGGDATALPWLVRVHALPAADGHRRWRYAFLPWHPSADERRAHLSTVHCSVSAPEGFALESVRPGGPYNERLEPEGDRRRELPLPPDRPLIVVLREAD